MRSGVHTLLAQFVLEIPDHDCLVPFLQAMWVRFLSHVAFSLAVFGPRNFGHSLKSARPGLQLLRSVTLMTTTGLNFLALRYLQLDQIATIFFLTPFVVAVLAGPILGEWIGWRRLVAILIGFSGVILIMRPGFGGIHWAVSYSFCATICYAIYNILTRYLARHDSSMVTQVYSPLAGLVILTPLGLWAWEWPAQLSTWLIMLSMGISGGFGHYLLIFAHRRAPAPILAPFTYVGLLSPMCYVIADGLSCVQPAAERMDAGGRRSDHLFRLSAL